MEGIQQYSIRNRFKRPQRSVNWFSWHRKNHVQYVRYPKQLNDMGKNVQVTASTGIAAQNMQSN